MTFELLPFHIIFVATLALFFYGYEKKSILITNLSAIALTVIGVYGMIHGFPAVTGTTQTILADGTVTTTKVMGHVKDFVTEIASIVAALIGVSSLWLVNFELWEERKL